jgi:outer membrane receptor protein involved in Fe transport
MKLRTMGACLSATVPFLAIQPGFAASNLTPETVVVTATRSAIPLASVPESVSVVTSEQVEDTPAQALDDVLRNLPGLTLNDIGPDAGHPTAYNESMRGLPTTETRMLVMVDGVPVNDPFFGYIQWNRIPLDNIDRVEIVRGGGSPLWGNTAMGGVVNVITRAPAANELIADAGGGSYGNYRGSVYGSYAAAPWLQLSLNAALSGSSGYQTTPPSWTSFSTLNLRSPVYTDTPFSARNIDLRSDFKPAPGLTGFLNVIYNEDRQILQTPIGLNRQRLWTYAAGIREEFTGATSLALTFFHDDNDFITNNPHLLTFTTEYNSNIHTTTASDNGASLVFTQALSGPFRSMNFGADLRQISGRDVADYYVPSGELAVPPIIGGGHQLFLAGFTQMQLAPFEGLEILVSLRYQYYRSSSAIDTFPPGFGAIPDSTKYRFTPRVDAGYAISDEFTVRGAYYQSFRAPTLDQLYRTYADTTAGIYEGNPFLLPETLEGEEIGIDFHRPGLRAQFTAYSSAIANLINQRNLDSSEYPDILGVTCGYDAATFTYLTCTRNVNAASAVARGVEAEITWNIDGGFSTELTYTYADSHYTADPVDPTAVGERLEGVPMHNASAALTYASPSGWRATTILRYISKSFGDAHPADGLIQDAHFVVDASGSYPLTTNLVAYVQIQNLFNRRYIASNGGGAPILGTPFEVMSGLRVTLM